MYKYKAFISYRHIPFDSAVAERVMRLIEIFTPPRSMRKNGKFEKWRCFRDEEELPLSKNLGDDIHEALRNSEFLIIICSPEYNESQWCLEELRYFKEIHGGSTSNIAVISISGEPSKTFPEGILSSTEDGKVISVEPLSADIRADTTRQSLKKLNTLYLKMIARFLGCEYNDLVQRQEKRKRKKMIILSSIIISILLAFIFVLTYSYTRIREKNKDIEDKNLSLQIENSIHSILESKMQFRDGKPLEAVQSALNAMPSENNSIPLLPEAVYNLSTVIGAYKMENFQPSLKFDHENNPAIIGFSSNGNTLITTDTHNLYFWDTQTGKLLNKYGSELVGSGYSPNCIFLPTTNRQLELTSDSPVEASFTLAGDKVFENYSSIETPINPQDVLYVTEVGENSSVYQLNAKTGEKIWEHHSLMNASNRYALIDGTIFNFIDPHDSSGEGCIEILDSQNGQTAFSFYPNFTSYPDNVLHYNPETKEIMFIETGGYICHAKIEGERLSGYDDHTIKFCAGSDQQQYIGFSELTNYYETGDVCIGIGNDWYTADYVIDAITPTNQSVIWEFPLAGVNADTLLGTRIFTKNATDNSNDILAIISNKSVMLIDCLTGICLHTYYIQTKIVDYWCSENGYIIIITDQGTEMALTISDNSYCAILMHQFPSIIDEYAAQKGKYAMSQNNSNRVYLFQDVDNSDYTELINRSILNTDKEIQIDSISESGKEIHYHEILYDGPAMVPANHLIYNTETHIIRTDDAEEENFPEYAEEKLPEWIPEERMNVYGLSPFNVSQSITAVIMENYTIQFYQTDQGEFINEVPIQNVSTEICYAQCLEESTSAILIGADNQLYKISLSTGELLETIKLQDLPQGYEFESITFLSEPNHIILTFWTWEQSYGYHAQKYAWFIDTDSFSVEMCVPNYYAFHENTQTIYLFDSVRYRFGIIPRFSTDQLIHKAKEYIYE